MQLSSKICLHAVVLCINGWVLMINYFNQGYWRSKGHLVHMMHLFNTYIATFNMHENYTEAGVYECHGTCNG